MPARLILNADDFGLTPGINRAIGELNSAGVLTSAASSIGPISAGAHHVCFSIWTFFAVYGDAVSQVRSRVHRCLLTFAPELELGIILQSLRRSKAVA